MEGRRQPCAARANQRIPVQEFAAQFQTKRECFNFLTQNCEAYEPPVDTVTIWHLKDQINYTKGFIKGTEVKHLTVPHCDNLTLEKILVWLTTHHPNVMNLYFPQTRDLEKFPRKLSEL